MREIESKLSNNFEHFRTFPNISEPFRTFPNNFEQYLTDGVGWRNERIDRRPFSYIFDKLKTFGPVWKYLHHGWRKFWVLELWDGLEWTNSTSIFSLNCHLTQRLLISGRMPISKEYLQRISKNRKRNRNILRWEMLAQVLREVYANNQFLLFRRLTPAQYFPSRHAGTPRITSCLRRNFRRNVHGFQSGSARGKWSVRWNIK